MDYVKSKLDSQKVKYQINNMNRKIEIADIAYEKAKRFLGFPDFPSFEEFYANEAANQSSNDN
jgi:hypothetical protein